MSKGKEAERAFVNTSTSDVFVGTEVLQKLGEAFSEIRQMDGGLAGLRKVEPYLDFLLSETRQKCQEAKAQEDVARDADDVDTSKIEGKWDTIPPKKTGEIRQDPVQMNQKS